MEVYYSPPTAVYCNQTFTRDPVLGPTPHLAPGTAGSWCGPPRRWSRRRRAGWWTGGPRARLQQDSIIISDSTATMFTRRWQGNCHTTNPIMFVLLTTNGFIELFTALNNHLICFVVHVQVSLKWLCVCRKPVRWEEKWTVYLFTATSSVNMFVFTCYVTLIITVMYRRLVVM